MLALIRNPLLLFRSPKPGLRNACDEEYSTAVLVLYRALESGARYRRTMATREQEHGEQSAPTDTLSGTPLGEEEGAVQGLTEAMAAARMFDFVAGVGFRRT